MMKMEIEKIRQYLLNHTDWKDWVNQTLDLLIEMKEYDLIQGWYEQMQIEERDWNGKARVV